NERLKSRQTRGVSPEAIDRDSSLLAHLQRHAARLATLQPFVLGAQLFELGLHLFIGHALSPSSRIGVADMPICSLCKDDRAGHLWMGVAVVPDRALCREGL